MRKKYTKRFRVIVGGDVPDFVFYTPNALAAGFYTEMCGFDVVSKDNG